MRCRYNAKREPSRRNLRINSLQFSKILRREKTQNALIKIAPSVETG